MQKRFSEYLIYNEGKTTGREAAIAAGYSKDRASVEASELQNPTLSPSSSKIHRRIERREPKEIRNYI